MQTLQFVILFALFLLTVWLFFLNSRANHPSWAALEHRRYAHRGLHCSADSVPENSLAAFRRAIRHGYGSELDVHLLRDGTLAVFHDSDLKRMTKELRVSAIVGAVLGIVNGLRIYLMYTFLFPGQYANVMGYAIVVSVSLFFSVILAKLVGGMLPLAAKKLGADPAIMATPFITTIVDACSLILYFQIAQLVFRNMM